MTQRDESGLVSSEARLVEVLTLAQRRLVRGLAAVLAEEGASVEQWRIMRRLGDGQGHAMGELAEALAIAHPTLTRIVDGLTDASLVYRRQSRTDRRRVAVHLSRRGHERLRRLDALAAAHEDAVRGSEEWIGLRRELRWLSGDAADVAHRRVRGHA